MQACVVGLGEVYGWVVYAHSVCACAYLCGHAARFFPESGAKNGGQKNLVIFLSLSSTSKHLE